MTDTPLDTGISTVIKCDDAARWPYVRATIETLAAAPPDTETVLLTSRQDIWQAAQALSVDACPSAPTALTAARNKGVRATTNQWVAFFDDDAVPTPGWAKAIAEAINQFDADAAGGPLVPRWETAEPAWLPESYHWLIGCGPYYNDVRRVPNTYGSNLVVRRDAFDAVGGFEESIGMGSGGVGQAAETDLCRRLREAGFEAVTYHPDATVEHAIQPTDVGIASLFARAVEQGRAKAHVGVGGRESTFIREELGRQGTLRQRLAELALTGAVGAGWIRGKVIP